MPFSLKIENQAECNGHVGNGMPIESLVFIEKTHQNEHSSDMTVIGQDVDFARVLSHFATTEKEDNNKVTALSFGAIFYDETVVCCRATSFSEGQHIRRHHIGEKTE